MKFSETKSARWQEGKIPAIDKQLYVHCTTLKPAVVMKQGLDPSKSDLDRLLTEDPSVMRYNCFLYAFNLEHGRLCKAHRMSQWAEPGNYAYVFSGSGRRYMSDRKLLKNVEVGFLDDVLPQDIKVYKIGPQHVLMPHAV